MLSINLLPWRAQKRAQEKSMALHLFWVGLTAAFLVLLLLAVCVGSLLKKQRLRNALLRNEIVRLDAQIKEIKAIHLLRELFLKKLFIVQELQSSRSLLVHLFDELAKILPEGVYLGQLLQEGDAVALWGYSESSIQVSLLLQLLEQNPWLHAPKLSKIRQGEKKQQKFKLTFMLKQAGSHE